MNHTRNETAIKALQVLEQTLEKNNIYIDTFSHDGIVSTDVLPQPIPKEEPKNEIVRLNVSVLVYLPIHQQG